MHTQPQKRNSISADNTVRYPEQKVIFFRSAERSECQCGCNGDRKEKELFEAGKIFRGTWNGYASSLVATDKNSIYDRAKESGSTKDIVSSAKKMVESYNATLKQLRETGDTLNEFYRQQLKDIPAGDKEALKSIGITQAKDGSLSIDEKVLQSADADTLKKVLDGDTGLASKISFVSGRISQNAASNVVSTSSQYTSNGSSLLSALETSKYDFWG